MENEGAQRRLDQLFGSLLRLPADAPPGEAERLHEAVRLTITAYEAAKLLSGEEASIWRRKLVELGAPRSHGPE